MFTFLNPSLWLRAASLSVLVIVFQVLVAHVSLQKETKRRLQHALTGHAMVQISYVVPREMAIVLLGGGAAFIFVLQKSYPDQYRKAVGPLLRPNEFSELPGAFWFVVGTACTLIVVNDMVICRYALECLSFADPMASWIGSTVKSPKLHASSSLSGCLACFLTALLVGRIMLDSAPPLTLAAGAITCTVAESLTIGNDNLSIPVLTALSVKYFR